MAKIFESYHLFIPGACKPLKMILLYLVEPVILFFLARLGAMEPTGSIFAGCLVTAFSIEMLIDMTVFGGIQKKSSRQTVFLRIPADGLCILKYGLLGEFLRRVYIIIVPGLVAVICLKEAALSVSRALMVAFICLFGMELILFIVRFFDNLVLNIMVTSFSFGAISGLVAVLLVRDEFAGSAVSHVSDYVIAGCFAAACFLIYFVRSKISVKKAKEAYYE